MILNLPYGHYGNALDLQDLNERCRELRGHRDHCRVRAVWAREEGDELGALAWEESAQRWAVQAEEAEGALARAKRFAAVELRVVR